MLWNIGEEIKKEKIKKIDDQIGNLTVPITGSNLGSTVQICPSPYNSVTITDPGLNVDLDWLQSKAVSVVASGYYTKGEVLDLLKEVLLAYEEHGLSSAMNKIDIEMRRP